MNIPPIPPAPKAPEPAPQYPSMQYPAHPPQGYGQQAFPTPEQVAPPQYGPDGYPVQPQGYAASGPYVQPQPGAYYQPPGQWAPPGQQKAKSSGYRIAAGIVGIVLGTWLIVPSMAGFGAGGGDAFMAFLILIAALGNIAAGIVLLANQRSRNQAPPIISLSFAGVALLLGFLGLVATYFGVALFMSSLLLATPVLIVMGLGLARERRSA